MSGLRWVRLFGADRRPEQIEGGGPFVAALGLLHEGSHHDAGCNGSGVRGGKGLVQRHLEDAVLSGGGQAGGVGLSGGGREEEQGRDKATHGADHRDQIRSRLWRGILTNLWQMSGQDDIRPASERAGRGDVRHTYRPPDRDVVPHARPCVEKAGQRGRPIADRDKLSGVRRADGGAGCGDYP